MQLDTILTSLKDLFVKTVRQEVNAAIAATPITQGFDKDALYDAVGDALSAQDKNAHPCMDDVVRKIEGEFSEWFDNCMQDVDFEDKIDIHDKISYAMDDIDWEDKVSDCLYQNDIPNEGKVVEIIEDYLQTNAGPAAEGTLTLAGLGELLLKAAASLEETTTETADTKEVQA